MAGALIHITAGLLSSAYLYYKEYEVETFYAIIIGNLLPDAFKFSISALAQGTLRMFDVKKDQLYNTLSAVTSNVTYWFSFAFIVIVLIGFLYHYHYIKKKTMREYTTLTIFLIIGILTHLILDVLIIETGVWI